MTDAARLRLSVKGHEIVITTKVGQSWNARQAARNRACKMGFGSRRKCHHFWRRANENCGGRGKEKARNFGSPPLRGPHSSGHHPRPSPPPPRAPFCLGRAGLKRFGPSRSLLEGAGGGGGGGRLNFSGKTWWSPRTLISRSNVPSPPWTSRNNSIRDYHYHENIKKYRPILFQERSVINESDESRNTPWMDRTQKDDALYTSSTTQTRAILTHEVDPRNRSPNSSPLTFTELTSIANLVLQLFCLSVLLYSGQVPSREAEHQHVSRRLRNSSSWLRSTSVSCSSRWFHEHLQEHC